MRRRKGERPPIHDRPPPALLALPLLRNAAGSRIPQGGAGFRPQRTQRAQRGLGTLCPLCSLWPKRDGGRVQGRKSFPTIGKKVSNHWKKRRKFSNHWKKSFQSLEKNGKFFPIVGKRAKNFSNRWKTSESGRGRAMRADGKRTVERMAGKREPPRNPMMRILAGLVAVFMVVMIPVAFVCVEGWWRKLCVLSMFSFVFLFGQYALGGREGARHEGGRDVCFGRRGGAIGAGAASCSRESRGASGAAPRETGFD